MYIGVRITKRDDDFYSHLCLFSLEYGFALDKMLVCMEGHNTENEHYHIMIQNIEIIGMKDRSYKDKFLKDIKKSFIKSNKLYKDEGQGGKRNFYVKLYSDKELSKGYMYLCKGKDKDTMPDIILNEGILTDKDIEHYHNLYWNQPDKVKKEISLTGDEKFLEWFKENKLNRYNIMYGKYYFKTKKLVDDILEFYDLNNKGYKKQLLEHKMNLLCNTIVRRYSPEQFEDYKNHIYHIFEQFENILG